MTSLKSSANKIAEKYDFKYSLKSMIFPAIVSFLYAVYALVWNPLVCMSNCVRNEMGKFSLEKTIAEIKLAYSSILTFRAYNLWSNYTAMSIVIICIGVLFAFVGFMFLMKKNRVNLFLSSPVGRAAMFKNRVIAAIILMAGTVALPLAVDVFINIYVFGKPGYFVWHGILLFGEYMAYLLAGFSIMSISMLACNTIIESLFFGAGALWLPTIACAALELLSESFLRGYNGRFFGSGDESAGIINKLSIINPIFLGNAFGDYNLQYNMFSFVFRGATNNQDYLSPDTVAGFTTLGSGYKWAQMNIIAPFLIWFAISALFIFVAKKLFLARKAESAGMHATAHVPTAIFSIEVAAFAGSFVAYATGEADVNSVPLSLLISIAAMLLTYYVVNAICKRKMKLPSKVHYTALGTACCFAVVVVVLSCGGFGYTTYVPDANDVEFATVNGKYVGASGNEGPKYSSVDNNEQQNPFFSSYYSDSIGAFSSADDINKLIEVNKSVAKKTDDMTGTSVKFVYKLKNGKYVSRKFKTTDYEACFDVLSLTDAEAYNEELEYLLSSKRKNDTESKLGEIIKNNDLSYDAMSFFAYSDEKTTKKLLHLGNVKLINDDLISEKVIENTPALKDALLADLISADYKQTFRPQSKPIGEIIFYDNTDSYEAEEDMYYTDQEYVYDEAITQTLRYYIYEDMKNTISYLKSTGDYDFLTAPEEYDIKTAEVIKISDYIENRNSTDDSLDLETMTYMFNASYQFKPELADDVDMLGRIDRLGGIESVEGEDLKNIEDKEKINYLYSVSRSFAYCEKDDYLAIFTLADGTEIARLIYSGEYK